MQTKQLLRAKKAVRKAKSIRSLASKIGVDQRTLAGFAFNQKKTRASVVEKIIQHLGLE